MTDPVQRFRGAVLIQGEGLEQIARCVLAQIREVQRNGYSVEPYVQLFRAIHIARTSHTRHEDAVYQVVQAHSESQDGDDLMDTAAVSSLLGISCRQVQRLAPGLGAVHVGNALAFKRSSVLALAEERNRKARNGERQSRA